jgi:hypothetical protein
MSVLVAVVLLAAADQAKGGAVSVDSATVNGQPVAPPPPPPPPPAQSQGVSGAASPGPISGQLWSVVTPRTIGQNGNALETGFGFPGIYGSYLHGFTPTLDLGARLSANYGLEGQVNTVQPELKLQALLKYRIMDNGKVSLGVKFEPGPLLSFPSNRGAIPGFTLPASITLGIVATSALNIGVTFEIPFWLQFGNRSSAIIPVLMGAGAEYFVSSSLAVWFAVRMGPSIWTNGDPAQFTFDGRLGVGWRF